MCQSAIKNGQHQLAQTHRASRKQQGTVHREPKAGTPAVQNEAVGVHPRKPGRQLQQTQRVPTRRLHLRPSEGAELVQEQNRKNPRQPGCTEVPRKIGHELQRADLPAQEHGLHENIEDCPFQRQPHPGVPVGLLHLAWFRGAGLVGERHWLPASRHCQTERLQVAFEGQQDLSDCIGDFALQESAYVVAGGKLLALVRSASGHFHQESHRLFGA